MFLTPKLKAYYMQDFNDNVLSCTDDFWKIDDNLRELLININKNQNVQTLYSRRRNSTQDTNEVSFLWVLHSKTANQKTMLALRNELFEKIHSFRGGFKPVNINLDMGVKMNCMNDKNYFKNGALMLTMSSKDINQHNLFWDILEKHIPNF
jgi:hypothetical protein